MRFSTSKCILITVPLFSPTSSSFSPPVLCAERCTLSGWWVDGAEADEVVRDDGAIYNRIVR